MPKYKELPENRELVDVLSCVILGHHSVKDMIRVLKQPQSTISEKIRFLIKSGAIKKQKWDFEVEWGVLYKIFYQTIRKHFDAGLVSSKKSTKLNTEKIKSRQQLLHLNLENAIPKPLVRNIFVNYSSLIINFDYRKFSIFELVERLLDQLSITSDSELKDNDEFYKSNLLRLKKLLKYRMTENEFLFSTLISPP